MLNSRIVPASATRKRALIFGVSGQDGAYLAQLLLARGYHVRGNSRSPHGHHANLHALGIASRIQMCGCNMLDAPSILDLLRSAAPDEIYNLAGQTSVSRSFDNPLEALQSLAHSTLNLLEAVRLHARPTRIFHASSAECFGDHGRTPMNESTPFRPLSPYAVAKASAHFQVASYRQCFGLYACSGILFNHESPLRPQRFVTQKIVAAAGAISRGERIQLHLGNIDVVRDWGWAPEYVQAMWRMLQQSAPEDLILATGESHSLRDFIAAAFAHIGRDSAQFVLHDHRLLRPAEVQYSYADPSRTTRQLGWSATSTMHDVVRRMLEADSQAHVAELSKTQL
jgi:GDPmannose 4,6-dehydratase